MKTAMYGVTPVEDPEFTIILRAIHSLTSIEHLFPQELRECVCLLLDRLKPHSSLIGGYDSKVESVEYLIFDDSWGSFAKWRLRKKKKKKKWIKLIFVHHIVLVMFFSLHKD